MLKNKYSGMSVINSGVERDLSRRGKFKGSARVDARRGLGPVGGSVGASSGGSGGFMSGLGRRMSSARSTVGEGFSNASRRAYIGGTTMMDSAEAGMRSGAARMGRGLGGSLNINMKGFGATSGVATGNSMQRAIGAGAARAGHNMPMLGRGPSAAQNAMSLNVRRNIAVSQSIRAETQHSRNAFDGARAIGDDMRARTASKRAAVKVNIRPRKGAEKIIDNAVTRDKGKNLTKLMEHVKGNPKAYAIGAGVIGLGALLNGREKRGTSSGAQGMYR